MFLLALGIVGASLPPETSEIKGSPTGGPFSFYLYDFADYIA